MSEVDYVGILCIGDPHLCTWAPGYRKDEYGRVILGKLKWALDFARAERLLPVLLGDLFHVPRENANWLISELIQAFDGPILCVVGNHDMSEDVLCPHDSLNILLSAGSLRPIDDRPWQGTISGVPVAIGGTNNGRRIPASVDRGEIGNPKWVFWITHHDLTFPGYEEAGKITLRELPGVDLVINGHIHRPLPDVVAGTTTWCNPGNIARVSRSDATRQRTPSVLRIDVDGENWTKTVLTIPAQPFDDVFFPVGDVAAAAAPGTSGFISGLLAMQKFKTADGEGLRRLIAENMDQIPDLRVKQEIMVLLKEVLPHAQI